MQFTLVIYLYYIVIASVTISPSGPIQGTMVGSPQVINCTVSTVSGVESSSVMISWMGPGGNIDATNGRVSIGSVTAGGNNMYTRSLQFTYLMEGDNGTYICHGTVQGVNRSQSVELQSLTGKLFGYLAYIAYIYILLMQTYHVCMKFEIIIYIYVCVRVRVKSLPPVLYGK